MKIFEGFDLNQKATWTLLVINIPLFSWLSYRVYIQGEIIEAFIGFGYVLVCAFFIKESFRKNGLWYRGNRKW